jgi:GTP-binding protein
VYAIGKLGIAKINSTDESSDLTPLLDTILEKVPLASDKPADVPARAQPFNLAYDNFLGRMGVVRMYEGTLKTGGNIFVHREGGSVRNGKITKMFTFEGLKRVEATEITPGDIALIAGIPDIGNRRDNFDRCKCGGNAGYCGRRADDHFELFGQQFSFWRKEGKFVTSRQLRDRLERELEINVGLRVDFTSGDTYKVSGRGELHVAILLENMRREGYEMQVSQPQVIFREENGVKTEPFEEVIIDTPSEFQGPVIEKLGMRGFVMTNLVPHEGTVR